MQSAEQLLPLRDLTALTFLTTSDITDAGLSALAHLHSLRHLDIERATGVTAQGLMHLTALKGLTQLRALGSACVFGAHHHCRVLHLVSRCQVRRHRWWQNASSSKHRVLLRLLGCAW